jgi:DNA-binding response OmpR family regulator
MTACAPQPTPSGNALTSTVTRRILIVDDEPAILFAYRKLLERENIVVDTCESLAEALEMISLRLYSAVVADMRLAGTFNTDGLQALRLIQEKQSGARVILVTGCSNKEIEQRALEMGAAYYFEKPVMPSKILAALKAIPFTILSMIY